MKINRISPRPDGFYFNNYYEATRSGRAGITDETDYRIRVGIKISTTNGTNPVERAQNRISVGLSLFELVYGDQLVIL